MAAPSEAKLDWAAHRTTIRDLYWVQAKELPEVMKIMEAVHAFTATKKMYKKHLKDWGLEKNIKTAEGIAMLKIAEQRRRKNKETLFIRRGRPVDPGKLRRLAQRHKLAAREEDPSLCGEQAAATPPEITYTTPEPDASYKSQPPAPQPFLGDSQATGVGRSPAAHAGTHDTGARHRALPSSEPGPDHMRSGSLLTPTHTTVAAQFIPDAFSAHCMPDTSHHVPRINMSSLFPVLAPHPWLDPAEDGGFHGHGTLMGLTPPPCGPWDVSRSTQSGAQTLPPCGIPFFPGTANYDSGTTTHAMLGMPSPLSATTGPPRASSTTPQTIQELDLTPLHRAVISSNVGLTRTLLEDGSNANCAARGGMTPLHYAAYQRDAELVRLLKNYGANLEAVTDSGRSVLFFAVRGHARLGSCDMLPYAGQARPSQNYHTDEATVRVIDALYNHPAGWARLLRALALADKDGVAPLMLAAEGCFTQTVTMFLQRGARPEARDHAGQTALRYAAAAASSTAADLPRRRALVRLLLQADERVQACDLAHVLKLAGRNCTATTARAAAATEELLRHQGSDSDGGPSPAALVVGDEVVRVCREMDVLGGLLGLAEQKGKAGLLELLLGAASRLDREGRNSRPLQTTC